MEVAYSPRMLSRLALLLALLSSCAPPPRDSHEPNPPTPDAGQEDAGVVVSRPLDPCDEKQQAFDKLVSELDEELKRNGIPGGALALVCDGRRIFSAGVGMTRAGQATSVSTSTRFQLASITKTLTALAAVRLAAEGKVRLDEPVDTYVPFVNTRAPFARPFTLAELLSHTSGYAGSLRQGDYSSLDLEQFFRNNPNEPLWAPPGAVWNYNNAGYALAGLALQRETSRPFDTLIAEQVLRPMKMTRATLDATQVMAEGDFSYGHTESGKQVVMPTDSYLASGFYAPMGGAWASVDDMAILARAMLEDAQAFEALTTPRSRTELPSQSYGLGLFLDRYGPHDKWSHTGSVAGYLSSVEVYPDLGLAVVLLVNGDWYFPYSLLREAQEDFSGLVLDPPEEEAPRAEDEPEYEGRYESVSLGTIIVRREASGLTIDFVSQGFSAPMTGLWRDGYFFDYQPWQTPLVATFWREGSSVKYLVTSAGVGLRIEARR
jgi:CubicO group peptidase (beta-lactamase class C family)